MTINKYQVAERLTIASDRLAAFYSAFLLLCTLPLRIVMFTLGVIYQSCLDGFEIGRR